MREPFGPKPPEVWHDTYGGHRAIWVVTSCGHDEHPTYWSCSTCGERPAFEEVGLERIAEVMLRKAKGTPGLDIETIVNTVVADTYLLLTGSVRLEDYQ